MKRSHRLTHSPRIGQVRQRGRTTPHPLIVLAVAPAATPDALTRHAFAVGKRIGKANIRNLVKRRMREAVRVRESLIVPGYDILWIAREPIVEADFWAIDAAVAQVLRRAKLLRSVAEASVPQITARPHGTHSRPALIPGSIAATKRAASKAQAAKRRPKKAAQRPITRKS